MDQGSVLPSQQVCRTEICRGTKYYRPWLNPCAILFIFLLSGCSGSADMEARGRAGSQSEHLGPTLPFTLPSLETLPADDRSDLIRLGYHLVAHTQEYARAYVGNALNCTNCHLNAVRTPHSAPFVGLAMVFPEYRARNARVNRLEDRLDDCFERSMNGRPLPPESRDKAALIAYIEWLSEGVSKEAVSSWRGFRRIASSRQPDPARGKVLFEARCGACHGAGGQDTAIAPPMWGPRSYNIGAGMARMSLAASFIKESMPLGQGGSLSAEDAYDLAAFINRQPRPDFAKKHLDWPQGGKPVDTLY